MIQIEQIKLFNKFLLLIINNIIEVTNSGNRKGKYHKNDKRSSR